VRADAERHDQVRVFGIERMAGDHFGSDGFQHLGLARCSHPRGRCGRAIKHRMIARQLFDQGRLVRQHMGRAHASQLTVFHHVDHAQIAQRRHRQTRHVLQGLLVIERRRQQLACSGQERQALRRRLPRLHAGRCYGGH
jgi:hypothetical protein